MANWTRDRNVFAARFPVDPERRDEFLKTFHELCAFAEPFYDRGCTFAFQGWARNPNEFVVFASWDEQVVRQLRATEEFQSFNTKMLDTCKGPLVMEEFAGMDLNREVFDIYPTGKSLVHLPGKTQEVVFL